MPLFSVVVLTKNEEKNILRCIQPWLHVAEVIVVDSGSTDCTRSIAEEAGAHVYITEWMGYGPTKNHGNALASHDWILSLDADEVANPELVADVCAHMSVEQHEKNVFSIRRIMVYMERKLNYGSCRNEFRVRLFNRRYVTWTDQAVHEELLLPTQTTPQLLQGFVLHYSYANTNDHWQRLQRYAALSAEEMKRKGRRSTWVKQYLSPLFGFIKNYFFRLGFLDGAPGWIYARHEFRYQTLKYRLLKQALEEKEH